jgi:hypothetical protein
MRELAIKRQNGTSFLKTAGWALCHSSEFREPFQKSPDHLEKPFPAPVSRIELVKQEAAGVHDRQALELVESAAQNVDSLFQAAAKEALTAHQYLNLVIRGHAHAGNAFGSNWKAYVIGASHKYDRVIVSGERCKGSGWK